jgi:hypothetical protein
LDVFSGTWVLLLLRHVIILTAAQSFGLLHRIPPQPVDKVPGSVPPELQEEFEESELFVPADAESHVTWQNNRNAANAASHDHADAIDPLRPFSPAVVS